MSTVSISPAKKPKPKESTIAALYQVVTAPCVDLSMQELREFAEMSLEQNKNKTEFERLTRQHGSANIIVNAIRLNNNKIAGWANFLSTLKRLPVDVHRIEWLDLSFNQLQTIEPSIGKLKGLVKLHLHANQIRDIHDVQKLADLRLLTDLTLHGNPIAERGRGKYRSFIIGQLKNLRSLDFTSLTERDHGLAESFCRNPTLMKSIWTDDERGKGKDPPK
jgi:Leucine-rich repeat (LRR) protein